MGFLISLLFAGSAVFAEIRANPSGEWGHGYIIGRPVRSSLSGVFFPTYELHVNQGGFTDNNLYIGSNVAMSTESKEVFEKFQSLNADHLYVFEYIDKFPLDPEIEDSHLQIIKVHTAEEFLQKFPDLAHSKDVQAVEAYVGSKSDGVRKGRIVDVERYGLLGNFCVFELNTGGLGGNGEAVMAMSVIDEKVCTWIESKIALGKDVEVQYAQDLFEIWQPSSYYANKIVLVEGQESVTVPQAKADNLESIKQQLLNDPQFLNQLREKLKN